MYTWGASCTNPMLVLPSRRILSTSRQVSRPTLHAFNSGILRHALSQSLHVPTFFSSVYILALTARFEVRSTHNMDTKALIPKLAALEEDGLNHQAGIWFTLSADTLQAGPGSLGFRGYGV